MRKPSIVLREALRDSDPLCERCVYARPEPFHSMWQRWRAAWLVLTGRADALRWSKTVLDEAQEPKP